MEARLNEGCHVDGAAMCSRAVMQSSQRSEAATTVEIVAAANRLSAVATPDWCDRAAACLALISPDCVAVAMLVDVDQSGAISRIEAAGASIRPGLMESVRAVSHTAPRTIDPPSEERLVSRAQRMTTIGWQPGPDGLQCASAGILSEQPGGKNWRSRCVGRLWIDIADESPMVGLVPMAPSRWLSVSLARPVRPWNLSHVTILEAVLPVIGSRLHLSDDGQHGSRWLTAREQEVLERLTRGESVRQIAAALVRSPHTVHDHIKSLHRKLGARTRGELIVRALGNLSPNASTHHDLDPRSEPPVVHTRLAAANMAA